MASSSSQSSLVKIVGTGSGGLDEMRDKVNDSTVQFALLRFVFGSGSFKRSKLLFMHINGENCGAVRKGRFNTKKADVKTVCGSTHAELQVETQDEASVDNVLEKMSKVFAVDEMGDFSISQMKADYEEMIERNKATAAAASSGAGQGKRKTAAELGTVEANKALEEVRKRMGHFNWALFKPSGDLQLYNAGSLSINEMREWLEKSDKEVLYGLVRMGFGSGQFRRIKWIHLRWKGENVSVVKRGQAQAKAGEMHDRLMPFSVTVDANSLDDCKLEDFIDKVRRAAVIDGEGGDGDDDPFSMKKFLEALEEEKKASAEFFGDTGETSGEPGEPDLKSTLESIRTEGGALNWALFELR